MPTSISLDKIRIWDNNQAVKTQLLFAQIRSSIWFFGIPSWVLGISDRGVAALSDGYVSPVELFQVFTATLFFLSWLFLRPEQELNNENQSTLLPSTDSDSQAIEAYLEVTKARMLELQDYHLIQQEYILPFPYICQIYHLLNLKHLEKVHSFSLGNLRIVKVSDFQLTSTGGVIKFQTVLDSPFNTLRIWRQPIVEVELILHTPYTVELNIPVYNGKKIVVMFNTFPVNDTEHKFLVDIYSNLGWFKPLMKVALHFASCLTLFEDLPYLHALAKRNIQQLLDAGRLSNHETMKLFNRFAELYGKSLEAATHQKNLLKEQVKGLEFGSEELVTSTEEGAVC